jgi:hypothetical protein
MKTLVELLCRALNDKYGKNRYNHMIYGANYSIYNTNLIMYINDRCIYIYTRQVLRHNYTF